MCAQSLGGYERARVSLKCPRFSTKPEAYDDYFWSLVTYVVAINPRLLIVFREDNAPVTRAELKALITPDASEVKEYKDAKAADAALPHHPLVLQAARVAALGGNPTYEELYNALDPVLAATLNVQARSILAESMQGTNALLTLRRAGNNPWEMWTAIKTKYARAGPLSMHRLLYDLFNDVIQHDTKLETWMERQADRYEKLAALNCPFPDEFKCVFVLKYIEESKHLNMTDVGKQFYWSQSDAAKPTYDQLCKRIVTLSIADNLRTMDSTTAGGGFEETPPHQRRYCPIWTRRTS